MTHNAEIDRGLELDLTTLREVAQAATPGRWRWRSATTSNDRVYLFGGRGGQVVMTFERMGMQCAQPLFRRDGVLHDAGRENIYEFADAKHIATFDPSTVLALIDQLESAERMLVAYDRELTQVREAARTRPTSPDKGNPTDAGAIPLPGRRPR